MTEIGRKMMFDNLDTINSCGRIDYSDYETLHNDLEYLLDALQSAEERADKWKAQAGEAYKDGLRTGHKNNEYREGLWDAERDRLQAELDAYEKTNEHIAKENDGLRAAFEALAAEHQKDLERAEAAESRYDALAMIVRNDKQLDCDICRTYEECQKSGMVAVCELVNGGADDE